MKKFKPDYFYHIAEPANLSSIQRHGLLSAERLMKLARMRGAELDAALGRHRPESLVLPGGVIIRDQSPMPPQALARALLAGMGPSDWYRYLNGFVFLWANRERVDRHMLAFKKSPQVLLVFDAPRLLEAMGERIFLSPINSGTRCARRRRGRRSFLSPTRCGGKRGGR